MSDLGLGFGDAAVLASYLINSKGDLSGKVEGIEPEEAFKQIYSGPKAELRKLHDAIMAQIEPFGPFEIAPKKLLSACGEKGNF